jgi:hypothetical protein
MIMFNELLKAVDHSEDDAEKIMSALRDELFEFNKESLEGDA